MRATILLLLAGLHYANSCPAEALSSPSKGQESIEIIIKDKISQSNPRSSTFNPFTAESFNTFVVLNSSNGYYGEVSLLISSTAGDNYTTTFNTNYGSILLPISGNTGFYTLTIQTESGLEFYGEFVI